MRIVWVSITGEVLRGAELSLLEAAQALTERGHEVHVVVPAEGSLSRRVAPVATVHVAPHNFWVADDVALRSRLRWSAYNLFVASRTIAAIARRVNADVVVSNDITVAAGALGARRSGHTHVWFLQALGLEEHGGRFFLGRRLSLQAIRRGAVLFLVNSRTAAGHFARWLPADRLRVVRLAVEVPEVPMRDRDAMGPFRLILVGVKRPAKGQAEALRALRILRDKGLDVSLDLVGDGPFEAELQAQARSAGIASNVRFLPFQDNPFELVASSDVALMCSRGEALGRVTIEAMKLGRPVVGASADGTRELIRNGDNGLLYEPGDAAGLADCVERLYRDRDRAIDIGRRGRAWALEIFNLEAFGADLEQALTEAARR